MVDDTGSGIPRPMTPFETAVVIGLALAVAVVILIAFRGIGWLSGGDPTRGGDYGEYGGPDGGD